MWCAASRSLLAARCWRMGMVSVANAELIDLAKSSRLVKTKMKRNKQTNFVPQHNMQIKFYHLEDPRILTDHFLELNYICWSFYDASGLWTGSTVLRWFWQWTCETSCKTYSCTAGSAFILETWFIELCSGRVIILSVMSETDSYFWRLYSAL